MYLPRLMLKNLQRNPLRNALTALGIVIAICAFGLLRTVVDSWYAGAKQASAARLVTRHAVSLTFSLPSGYAAKIDAVDGVKAVSWMNWFGGIYIDERNYFPQFAVAPSYFDMFDEYLMPQMQRTAFLRDRRGAIVGRNLAEKFGWRLGDQVPLQGTLYPGTWTFVVRGIYDVVPGKADPAQFFVHWNYVDQRVRQINSTLAGQVGVFFVQLDDARQAASVSQAIDAGFKNSLAETLTETQKAFQLGFAALVDTLLAAVQIVAFVVIGIIMAVMANTMAMTARERTSEYATLKALGFGNAFLALLIVGESLALSFLGGLVGIAATFPFAASFHRATGTLFATFEVTSTTVQLQLLATLFIGVAAAIAPIVNGRRVAVVDGLRAVA